MYFNVHTYFTNHSVKKNVPYGTRLFELSAAQGYPRAQNHLAVMYYEGCGGQVR